MECVWEEPVEKLFEKVMLGRGHEGWILRWANNVYCWKNRKIIDICPGMSEARCCQMLLHEIVHAELGNQHTAEFFVLLEQLVKHYLGVELDQHQLTTKSVYVPQESQ
jgi:hypothetical protein